MAFTIKEAAAMCCPFAFAMLRPEGDARFYSCVGERCMAWRWDRTQPAGMRMRLCEDVNATTEPARPEGLPASWKFFPFVDTEGDPACWLEPESEWRAWQRGYCGLVGAEKQEE